MPPVDSKYALKKMGKTKWKKVQEIARRFHWGCENDLYPSEVDWLSNTRTTAELENVVEDLVVVRSLWGAKPEPHLKIVKGGA